MTPEPETIPRPRTAEPEIVRAMQNIRLELAQMRVAFTQVSDAIVRVVDLLDRMDVQLSARTQELRRG